MVVILPTSYYQPVPVTMSHKDQTSSMFVVPSTFALLPAFLASGKCTVVLLIMEKIGIVKRWRCDSEAIATPAQSIRLSHLLCARTTLLVLVHACSLAG